MLRLKTRLVKAAAVLIKGERRTWHRDNEGDLRAKSHHPLRVPDCENANLLEKRALTMSCLNKAIYRSVDRLSHDGTPRPARFR